MSNYACPICATTDPNAYLRCNRPDCPDGRDPRPAPVPVLHGPTLARVGQELRALEAQFRAESSFLAVRAVQEAARRVASLGAVR